eukprot:gene16802-19154_t
MGSIFTSMGLATMIFPKMITELSFNKEFLGKDGVTPPLKLAMQCFGSQASLCGLLILSSKFTSRTYRNFGLAMIPYFVFDYYFWSNGALTTFGAAGDAIGNTVFASCCFLGHCLLTDKENGKEACKKIKEEKLRRSSSADLKRSFSADLRNLALANSSWCQNNTRRWSGEHLEDIAVKSPPDELITLKSKHVPGSN